ncbi:cellulose binding domain-containing protein, partial [Kitasatospora nipponensis]|uniref:cellulose binding domain-containing protein n=1 Tax=Kitasatospora nipponensis TaxID=258049 RepID=UPI0031DAA190
MSLRHTALALGAALAATAALVGPIAGSSSAAAVACTVDYSTNDWGSGFTANVKINNVGTAALNGWTLTYAYTGNQALSGSGWNGDWTQSGKNVTVSSLSWNATIAPRGNATPGANL